MTVVWCRRPSNGAQALVDKLVSMGHSAQVLVGGVCPDGAVRWGCGGGNKYQELVTLARAGVPVPEHVLPIGNARALIRSRERLDGWLGRRFTHRAANDLLRGVWRTADYYVRYVDCIREHRVHVWQGRVIRIAMKVPASDSTPPTSLRFRTHRAGWILRTAPECTSLLPPQAREWAKRAVEALGCQHGAVDVGTRRDDGSAIVFEVNSGPGLEGRTVDCYARVVIRAERRAARRSR